VFWEKLAKNSHHTNSRLIGKKNARDQNYLSRKKRLASPWIGGVRREDISLSQQKRGYHPPVCDTNKKREKGRAAWPRESVWGKNF